METRHVERIILIGPTGGGKTTAGRVLAGLLGWRFVDTDDLVAAAAGCDIPTIFARDGEPRFRDLECAALAEATEQRRTVIATGGGIGDRPENVALMRARGWVVCLAATPATALARLTREADDQVGARRPMLAGGDPLQRMRALHARRQGWYAAADHTITTDALEADGVATRIVAELVTRGLLAPAGAEERVTTIRTSTGDAYDAVVAWGGLATLAARLAERGLSPRVFVVADGAVADLYWPALEASLRAGGFEPSLHVVPPGEASKSRAQLDAIHNWLIERRAERGEAVIALGGGVVGDLAGFAAATYLRGVPLVQAPTSLLAQVDASIGGKVAIDHPRGKNLIGAFYPPRLVLADPTLLLTLPPRQLTEGWGEVVKHGVALDAVYCARIEEMSEALIRKDPAALTEIIAGSVAIKGAVVSGDEREREGGRRHLLNYGHTIAHAIETVAGYGAWLHGEAVAAGMAAEARLGARLGITPPELVARQDELLQRFGLPTHAGGLSATALLRACLWDKKVRGGAVRWVLPEALGAARLVSDVSDGDVRAALLAVGAVADEPPPASER
jgi:shikimate kinase/3-dehydroquinate synthase